MPNPGCQPALAAGHSAAPVAFDIEPAGDLARRELDCTRGRW